MRGLLADTNVQGHALYLRRLLKEMNLWDVLSECKLEIAVFADADLPFDIDDRTLWRRCQTEDWSLFTDNRNDDIETSLQTALSELWRPGDLPVITLADKTRFERSAQYRERVATEIAELMFGISEGEYRDRARIFVPR